MGLRARVCASSTEASASSTTSSPGFSPWRTTAKSLSVSPSSRERRFAPSVVMIQQNAPCAVSPAAVTGMVSTSAWKLSENKVISHPPMLSFVSLKSFLMDQILFKEHSSPTVSENPNFSVKQRNSMPSGNLLFLFSMLKVVFLLVLTVWFLTLQMSVVIN